MLYKNQSKGNNSKTELGSYTSCALHLVIAGNMHTKFGVICTYGDKVTVKEIQMQTSPPTKVIPTCRTKCWNYELLIQMYENESELYKNYQFKLKKDGLTKHQYYVAIKTHTS